MRRKTQECDLVNSGEANHLHTDMGNVVVHYQEDWAARGDVGDEAILEPLG